MIPWYCVNGHDTDTHSLLQFQPRPPTSRVPPLANLLAPSVSTSFNGRYSGRHICARIHSSNSPSSCGIPFSVATPSSTAACTTLLATRTLTSLADSTPGSSGAVPSPLDGLSSATPCV